MSEIVASNIDISSVADSSNIHLSGHEVTDGVHMINPFDTHNFETLIYKPYNPSGDDNFVIQEGPAKITTHHDGTDNLNHEADSTLSDIVHYHLPITSTGKEVVPIEINTASTHVKNFSSLF